MFKRLLLMIKPCLRFCLLSVIGLCICSIVFSQPYYFRRYQVENGLSHNTVYCSLQDKDGFLWFGTRDGLNRFDGKNFKVFEHDSEDSLTLKNNLIQSLHEDEAGNMWVGTYRGLYRYNRREEDFMLVNHTDSLPVTAIQSIGDHSIWFIAAGLLNRLDAVSGKITRMETRKHFEATSLCRDKNNNLWVGTNNGRLARYNKAGNAFTIFDIAGLNNTGPKSVSTIYPTSSNTLLVGFNRQPARIFDITKASSKKIESSVKPGEGFIARTFLEKKIGEYWIGTEAGIYIYSVPSRKSVRLSKNYNDPYALSDNAIYNLTLDKEGSVWVGTYFGGLNYFANQPLIFQKSFPDYSAHAISGNAITEIREDKNRDLWIATEDAGINRLNIRTSEFTHFLPDESPESISYFNIHCLLITGDTLWVGNFGSGIDLLDIKTGKVFKRFEAGNGDGQLRNNTIMRLCQSRSGDVYIGTERGLEKFVQKTGTFSMVAEIPSNETVYALLEDHKGTIWVGTRRQSVYFFDPESKATGTVKTEVTTSNGLDMGLNQVTGITEDRHGNLWFATEGSGVIKYIPHEQRIEKRYTIKNGLPSNTIFKILEDEQNHLWISTAKGLVNLNPYNDTIEVFTRANGLLNDQFNYNSGFTSSEEKMYFGSVKGLISFKPSNLYPVKKQSPLFITGFQVDNEELRVSGRGKSLAESVVHTGKVTLNFDQSSFSIDFATLSFIAPEMLQYRYIMSGLDEQWTYLKNNRKVYYTDLPPGDYIFKVEGANSSGVWSRQCTVLHIKIYPPYWAGNLAYAFYFLVFAGLVWLTWRFNHKRSEAKQKTRIETLKHEKEKQIYQAKFDFFTNIAHEIRTPLTLIKAPLEKVIRKAGSKHVFGNNLKLMESNTEQLIELTNQFLDFRKTEVSNFRMNFTEINVSELFLERFSSFRTIAEEKNILFTIETPEKPVIAFLDNASLQKIFNNLFNNALSYCEKFVKAKLYIAGEKFFVEFSNDGNLIPPEMKDIIFEPFYRMKATQQITGTGIGLALSRSLAEMQKGEINLIDNQESINYFVLTLPLNQEMNKGHLY